MRHVQRIIRRIHVHLADRPPGAADSIEGLARVPLQPIDGGKIGFDMGRRLREIAARALHQSQAAKLAGDRLVDVAFLTALRPDAQQFEAAAAKITDHAERIVKGREYASGCKFGFFRARQHQNFHSADPLDVGKKAVAVGCFPDSSRRERPGLAGAEPVADRGKALQRVKRALGGGWIKFSRLGDRAAKPAHDLFIEQGRGAASAAFVDHEPDRVRADVDHRNRRPVDQPSTGFDHGGQRLRLVVEAQLRPQGLRLATDIRGGSRPFKASPRPESDGLLMKCSCALNGASPFSGFNRLELPSASTSQLC